MHFLAHETFFKPFFYLNFCIVYISLLARRLFTEEFMVGNMLLIEGAGGLKMSGFISQGGSKE